MKKIIISILLCIPIIAFSQFTYVGGKAIARMDSLKQKGDKLYFTNGTGSVVYFRTSGDSLYLGDVNGEIYIGDIVGVDNLTDSTLSLTGSNGVMLTARPSSYGDGLLEYRWKDAKYMAHWLEFKMDSCGLYFFASDGDNREGTLRYDIYDRDNGNPVNAFSFELSGSSGDVPDALTIREDSTSINGDLNLHDSLRLRYLRGNAGKVLTLTESGGVYASNGSGGISESQDSLNCPITEGQVTTLVNEAIDTAIIINNLIDNRTATSSDTLDLTDAHKVVRMNVASANTISIPTNAMKAFPIKTQITIEQVGVGQTTIVAISGVTINSYGGALKILGQYAGCTLYKTGTNTWWLFGQITN
jgi:hypothetical protein